VEAALACTINDYLSHAHVIWANSSLK